MNENHDAVPQAGGPQQPAGQPGPYSQPGPYGQQGAYGQPGPYGAPVPPAAPPQRSWFARHKVLTGIGVLVALIVVGSALGGGGEDTPAAAPTTTAAADDGSKDDDAKDDEPAVDETTQEKPKEKPKEEPKQPGVGDKVRDGKFEFTVVEVSDGGTSIGPAGFAEKAQGRFVLVRVDVTNIGDEPQYFFGDNQSVFDAKDRKFAADTTAAIYLEDSSSFVEEINPGNTVEGTLVFDLPKDVEPERIELHDSVFSGGVVVDLR